MVPSTTESRGLLRAKPLRRIEALPGAAHPLWREAVEILLLMLVAWLGVQHLVQTYRVVGQSMDPDFHDQELIMVDKVSYFFTGGPQRGDVIVFHYPVDPTQVFIKRVIGLPGDQLSLQSGNVVLNGHVLSEPYIMSPINTAQYGDGPLLDGRIPPGEYYVMGDNRNNSNDSRVWGLLPRANIIGRALFVYAPSQYRGLIPRPVLQ